MISLYTTRLSLQPGFTARFEDYLDFIPAQRRLKYSQHTNESGRNARLAGELLSRFALQNKFNIQNTDIAFDHSDKGKPFVTGHPEMYFNISHSGDYIVCASANNLTGIDVERIRNTGYDIAKRYFTSEECFDLYSLPAEQQRDYFFILWTIKESYLKAIGEGLALNLNTFRVKRISTGFNLKGNSEAEKFQVFSFDLGDEYKMAVSTLDNFIPGSITPILIEQIIQYLRPFTT